MKRLEGLPWCHRQRYLEKTMDIQEALMLALMTVPTWIVAAAALITLLVTGA